MPKHSFKEYMPLIEEAFSRQQSVTIPVKGISMKPTLSPGDGVTLASVNGHRVKRGDILLYKRADGSFILHRVVRVTERGVDFCGDAQFTVEKDIPHTALIAYVSSYETGGVTHTLNDVRQEGRRRLRTRSVRRGVSFLSRFKKTPNKGNSDALKYIGRYVRRYIPSLLIMCVTAMVAAASGLGMALVSGRIIDKALTGSMSHFREWFYLLFVLLVVAVICNVLYSQLRVRAAGKMKIHMRNDLFAMMLNKSYLRLQKIHSGEILNRFTTDIQLVVDNATTILPQTVSIVTKLIGGLAFMLVVEPVFTSILIVIGVIAGIVLQLCSRYYKAIHKECQETEGKTRSFLQECTENLMVIKSFDSFDGVKGILEERQEINFRKQLKRNWYANFGNTAVFAGFTFAYYAGLAWGILRVAGVFGSVMSVGVFAAFLQIMEQVRAPFRNASGIIPQFYSMCASAERLLEFQRLPSEEIVVLPMTAEQLYDDAQWIDFDHIDFSYDRNTPVFRQASCRIRKNAFTAFVGESGIGKSTIIKILLGFLKPQSGAVAVHTDRTDISISTATRPLFTYVPQGNMVLSGTLLQNLTIGDESATQNDVARAIRLACLEDTVDALPQGLQTVIGERGVGLSEGQIQRLAIARALISRAPILLLDECTSALDAHTEQQLLRNLRSLTDRTIVFISHKEAVIHQADDILEIKDLQIFSRNKKEDVTDG